MSKFKDCVVGDVVEDHHGRKWTIDTVEFYYQSTEVHYYLCNTRIAEMNVTGENTKRRIGTAILPASIKRKI